MPKTHRKLQGQAEIIGGVIVLTALVLSMGLILASIGRLSSTSLTGISRRTLFESEKSFEKIDVLVSGGACYIVNSGSVPAVITRIWINNNPIDASPAVYPNLTLHPGEKIDVSQLKSIFNVEMIDHVVTTRGNVFPAEPECIRRSQESVVYVVSGGSGGYFSSREILSTPRVLKGITQLLIYANITSGANTSNHAILYRGPSGWHCVNMTRYRNLTGITGISPDLDQNGINELIVTKDSNCEHSSFTEHSINFTGKTNVTITFVFEKLLDVDEEIVDTISIYYRLVFRVEEQQGGKPQQIMINPVVRIENGTYSIRTMGPGAIISSRANVTTVFGSAIFPLRAFGQTLPRGIYDLIMDFNMREGASMDIESIRLEYIAIVGTNYSVYWSAEN